MSPLHVALQVRDPPVEVLETLVSLIPSIVVALVFLSRHDGSVRVGVAVEARRSPFSLTIPYQCVHIYLTYLGICLEIITSGSIEVILFRAPLTWEKYWFSQNKQIL